MRDVRRPFTPGQWKWQLFPRTMVGEAGASPTRLVITGKLGSHVTNHLQRLRSDSIRFLSHM